MPSVYLILFSSFLSLSPNAVLCNSQIGDLQLLNFTTQQGYRNVIKSRGGDKTKVGKCLFLQTTGQKNTVLKLFVKYKFWNYE